MSDTIQPATPADVVAHILGAVPAVLPTDLADIESAYAPTLLRVLAWVQALSQEKGGLPSREADVDGILRRVEARHQALVAVECPHGSVNESRRMTNLPRTPWGRCPIVNSARVLATIYKHYSTAKDWERAQNPTRMVAFVAGPLSPSMFSARRLRLFACACYRDLPLSQEDERLLATAEGIAEAPPVDWSASTNIGRCAGIWCLEHHARDAALLSAAQRLHSFSGPPAPWKGADLARCLFGNPFAEPAAVPPDTILTRTIAREIYMERTWADLPILADALADECYTDERVLAHLRGHAAQARGCWALDLVLQLR